ncbi:MAG TPA: hypothetical protein VMV18_11305 [bacterium]|nr:hypothetical protein [bacterium]
MRLRTLGAIACLVGLAFAQLAAFAHLLAHARPHVHAADGRVVWLDEGAGGDSEDGGVSATSSDVRALFERLEDRGAKPRMPAPAHEARGLEHFAFPLLAALGVLFTPIERPARAARAVTLDTPMFAPPARSFDSRGPPARG